jgi:hypothetical protein
VLDLAVMGGIKSTERREKSDGARWHPLYCLNVRFSPERYSTRGVVQVKKI